MLAKQQNIIPVKILKGAAIWLVAGVAFSLRSASCSSTCWWDRRSLIKWPALALEAMPGYFVQPCMPILAFARGTSASGAKSGQGHAMGATEPVAASGGGIKCAA